MCLQEKKATVLVDRENCPGMRCTRRRSKSRYCLILVSVLMHHNLRPYEVDKTHTLVPHALSLPTTLLCFKHNMSSSPTPSSGTNALPSSAAAIAKRPLKSSTKLSNRYSFASPISTIPGSSNSAGNRPCNVLNIRSLRPLASGE